MPAITRLAVLATALFAAALPASADPHKCETLVPLALEAVQTVIKDGATATVQVPLVDGYVKDSPGHGWITLLGGELDLMVCGTQTAGNPPRTASVISRAPCCVQTYSIMRAHPPLTTATTSPPVTAITTRSTTTSRRPAAGAPGDSTCGRLLPRRMGRRVRGECSRSDPLVRECGVPVGRPRLVPPRAVADR